MPPDENPRNQRLRAISALPARDGVRMERPLTDRVVRTFDTEVELASRVTLEFGAGGGDYQNGLVPNPIPEGHLPRLLCGRELAGLALAAILDPPVAREERNQPVFVGQDVGGELVGVVWISCTPDHSFRN